MSEVARFRLARAVQRRMPAADAIIRVVRDTGPNPGPTEFVETLQQVITADGNRWEKLHDEAEKLRAKVRWFVDPDVPGTPTGFNEGEVSEGGPYIALHALHRRAQETGCVAGRKR